jgi:hypothetical protein
MIALHKCVYISAYPYTTQYLFFKLLAREVLKTIYVAYFPLNASYLGNTEAGTDILVIIQFRCTAPECLLLQTPCRTMSKFSDNV